MCPKNLRTRLRPVNVCCAIVASHFVARRGGPSEPAAATAIRVEFRSISKIGSTRFGTEASQIRSSDHQNAKRRAGRKDAPARQNHLVTDCKSPKLPISQRPAQETSPLPARSAFRAADPIWGDNNRDSRGKPLDPHTFSCLTRIGRSLCTPFAPAPAGRPIQHGIPPQSLVRDGRVTFVLPTTETFGKRPQPRRRSARISAEASRAYLSSTLAPAFSS